MQGVKTRQSVNNVLHRYTDCILPEEPHYHSESFSCLLHWLLNLPRLSIWHWNTVQALIVQAGKKHHLCKENCMSSDEKKNLLLARCHI